MVVGSKPCLEIDSLNVDSSKDRSKKQLTSIIYFAGGFLFLNVWSVLHLLLQKQFTIRLLQCQSTESGCRKQSSRKPM